MKREYKKLSETKVMALNETTGIKAELTEGVGHNILSICLMYRTEDGNWAYKSPKFGAVAIRIPMVGEVAGFIQKAVAALADVDKKNPAPTASGPVTTTKLSIEELEKMLAEAKAKKAEPKPEPKPEVKELDIVLADFAKMSQKDQLKLLKSLTKKN